MNRKVVVIGGGIAGKKVIETLVGAKSNVEITLIDPKDYFEVPYAQLRAIVDAEGFGKTIRKPFRDVLPGLNHVADSGESFDDSKVILAGGSEVPYDYLVLATGSVFRSWSLLKGGEKSVDDRQKVFQDENARLAAAGDVLIIGGGAVGVELAGEIIDQWPDKNVHIVEGADRLLSRMSVKTSRRAESVLTRAGVKISRSTRLSRKGDDWVDSSGKTFSADVVYQAVGISINSDWIADGLLKKNDRGALKVDSHLRAAGKDHIFVPGDLNDVPEPKLGALATMQAKLVAENILALIKSSDASLKTYKPHGSIGFITLGRKKGAVQLPFGHPHFLIGMKKDLFVGTYLKPTPVK